MHGSKTHFHPLFHINILLVMHKDDNSGSAEPDSPRPLSEVLAENEAEIQNYLKTHYYNYMEFQNPPNDFDYKIRISELKEGDTLQPLSKSGEV